MKLFILIVLCWASFANAQNSRETGIAQSLEEIGKKYEPLRKMQRPIKKKITALEDEIYRLQDQIISATDQMDPKPLSNTVVHNLLREGDNWKIGDSGRYCQVYKNEINANTGSLELTIASFGEYNYPNSPPVIIDFSIPNGNIQADVSAGSPYPFIGEMEDVRYSVSYNNGLMGDGAESLDLKIDRSGRIGEMKVHGHNTTFNCR